MSNVSSAAQLTLRAVSKRFAHRRVLDAVSATVRPGERVGVVGENGSGKSTLLRLISGQERPDDGEVIVRAPGGVGHLGQVLDLPETATVQDAIDAALAEIRDLERRIGEVGPEDVDTFAELLAALELRDGYRADAKVEAAMSLLRIGHLPRDRQLGRLSGGQRARLALACVLSAEPELLLLDEPTNHLDAQALEWLEERLLAHRGTLVVVTHDRLLLDRVATAIIEVDGDRRAITRYGNGYAGFLAEKWAARRRWEQRYLDWVAEIEHWTRFGATTAYDVAPGRPIKDHNKCKYNGDGQRVQASITTRVRSAAERIDRLWADPVPRPPDPLRLDAPIAGGAADGVVLAASDVSVKGRLSLDELTIEAGSRLLVCGPNGAGKSTLLAVLAGQLRPDAGTTVRNGRIGFLAQESVVRMPDRTVLATFARGRVGTFDEHAERLLSLGLFAESDLKTPVGALSVGQQRRLSLARLLVSEVDALLLDEPTNHLSLTLVEELEVALDNYAGAVVVVSHDRLFRRRWAGAELELRNGRRVHATAGM
ncbi:ABC-F family ATP-binding cassette domain-containing protein [Kutzneria sp. NPDC052558]|uniref:ABC-F family ATP-binding cassette domain-containing protein n=1 Tax=Kutzneria sp. NPDC052558 TaxID=3364121 RepID=UPI0037CC5B41